MFGLPGGIMKIEIPGIEKDLSFMSEFGFSKKENLFLAEEIAKNLNATVKELISVERSNHEQFLQLGMQTKQASELAGKKMSRKARLVKCYSLRCVFAFAFFLSEKNTICKTIFEWHLTTSTQKLIGAIWGYSLDKDNLKFSIFCKLLYNTMYAHITGHTANDLILQRFNTKKYQCGMTRPGDAMVAKNYLTEIEADQIERCSKILYTMAKYINDSGVILDIDDWSARLLQVLENLHDTLPEMVMVDEKVVREHINS